MALPKEPRQKMINMMYLVLTALLALNVSSEILTAFKTVNTSLSNSNIIIDKANTGISESMRELLKDPNTREKAAIWGPKADSALAITRDVSAYISDLKQKLIKESGLKEDGTYKEDDLNASSRLFETQGEGKKLYDRLLQFRADITKVLPKDLAAQIDSTLPLDLRIPPTQNKGNNTWSAAYFRMTPTIAAVVMLNKFDNDVKRSGNMVANKCMEQVGKIVLRLDKFEPLVSQNTEYALPGMPIKITAGLGAFSTQNLPTVTINGSPRPVDPATGAATWETTASGGGEQSVRVNISFKDPNTGETKTAEKTVNYTVGQPSGASIFLERMNVMYIGEDNPVLVSSGSGKAEKMSVSFSNGTISGSAATGKYIAKPTTPGAATVNVNVDGKPYTFPIRVKYLPDPVPVVGTKSGGKMQSAEFKQMGGVRAILKDSEFESPFQVLSYTIAGNGAGFPQYTPVQINGGAWGSNAVISQCRPGSTIFIDDIIARGRDGKNRKLPSIAFQLQ